MRALLVLLIAGSAIGAPQRLAAGDFVKKVVTPHRGHILLVNFWATWCDPCVEEMPGLVHATNQPGVDLVVVSLDTVKNLQPVEAFLTKVGAHGPAFVGEMADPEVFINTIDKTWDGTVPYTLVYDRAGKLVTRLRGLQHEADLQKVIAGLH